MHNIACSAGDAYVSMAGFDIADFCVDIYYWLDKSTKLKQALQEFCVVCNTEYAGMVKHVSTRWLSLENAVGWILSKYTAIKSYFIRNEDRTPRFLRLTKQFEDPFTDVHLLFHLSALQQFLRVSKLMQLESPMIPCLVDLMHDFLAKFCCCFFNVKKVKKAGLIHVDLDDSKVRMSDDKLDIGFTTKALLKKLVDGRCDMYKVSKFYAAVCGFYEQGLFYARSRLPLNDPVLKNVRFLDFIQRDSAELSHVEFFANRIASAIDFYSSSQSMDQLKDEFISYQLLDNSDRPAHVWSKAAIYVKDTPSASRKTGLYSMDILWAYLSTITNIDGSPKFTILADVAQLVVTIPHSNAAEDCVFSLVRKNKTQF